MKLWDEEHGEFAESTQIFVKLQLPAAGQGLWSCLPHLQDHRAEPHRGAGPEHGRPRGQGRRADARPHQRVHYERQGLDQASQVRSLLLSTDRQK